MFYWRKCSQCPYLQLCTHSLWKEQIKTLLWTVPCWANSPNWFNFICPQSAIAVITSKWKDKETPKWKKKKIHEIYCLNFQFDFYFWTTRKSGSQKACCKKKCLVLSDGSVYEYLIEWLKCVTPLRPITVHTWCSVIGALYFTPNILGFINS